jgi:hypothetical protein
MFAYDVPVLLSYAITVTNLAMQYKGVVIAWHQKVLRPAIMPMRGDKFDKLNLVRQAGVMLAYSVVAASFNVTYC